MKRSQINRILAAAEELLADHQFALPPSAYWSPAHWREGGEAAREILEVGIGWDITDFGFDRFEQMGLVLFTLRNGRRGTDRYPKTYAEKIMLVGEGQLTLTHFHWEKTEDIINRGGGRLSLCLHNATDRDRQADTPVTVSMDGVRRSLPAGAVVTLEPGESITLPPRLYHSFWGERGTGAVLVGEVSTVNDDHRDNCFLEEQLRFPMIDEDEPPRRYLVGDYDMILEGMHGS